VVIAPSDQQNTRGTVTVQVSEDSGVTWLDYDQFVLKGGEEATYVSKSGGHDIAVQVRVTTTSISGGSVQYEVYARAFIYYGCAKITVYTSPTVVTATVTKTLGDTTATTRWAEGAWSTYRGFPHAVSHYAGRILYGGNTAQPLTLWFSETNQWTTFEPGELTTSSFSYTLDAAEQNAIRWILTNLRKGLIVGTLGGILEVQPQDSSISITVTNPPKTVNELAHPNGPQAPLVADSAVILLERGGGKIHELFYSSEEERLFAGNLNRWASHIPGDGFIGMCWMSRPIPILWAWRSDGTLCSMTFDRLGKAAPWTRHPMTNGSIEWACVIPGATQDQLWLVVNRTIGGSTVRYVEYLDVIDVVDAEQEDYFHVDSGLKFDGGAAQSISHITLASPGVLTLSTWPTDGDGNDMADGDNIRITGVVGMTELNNTVFEVNDADSTAKTLTLLATDGVTAIDTTVYSTYSSGGSVQIVENSFSGLSHLNAQSCIAKVDGGYYGTVTPSSGAVTLSQYFNTVHIGLDFNSDIETMPLDWIGRNGSTIGRFKKIGGLLAHFYRTCAPQYGPSSDQLKLWPFPRLARETGTWTSAPRMLSDIMRVDFHGGNTRDARVYLRQNHGLPMTVSTLYPEMEVS